MMDRYHIYTGRKLSEEENWCSLKFDPVPGITEKHCHYCGELKPISEFRRAPPPSRTGYRLDCNACHEKWRAEFPKTPKLPPRRPRKSRSTTQPRPKGVCEILASHHDLLKDDPDRLSTDFLKSLIGGAASNCEASE